MNFRRTPNPASLTAAERAEYRDAVVGNRYNGNRTDLPDGSCYYATEDGPGRYVLHAFGGKALRPSFIESYRTRERLEERIDAFKQSRERKADEARQAKAARQQPHTLKVGDVLNTCWGYEQTNCEFYEVVGVRGSHVLIHRLASADAGGEAGAMSGRITPLRGEYVGEILRRRANSRNAVSIESGITASPWDGSPVHVSSWH